MVAVVAVAALTDKSGSSGVVVGLSSINAVTLPSSLLWLENLGDGPLRLTLPFIEFALRSCDTLCSDRSIWPRLNWAQAADK